MEIYVDPYVPADRLIIVGHGGKDPVEEALVKSGKALGFETVVIDHLPVLSEDPDTLITDLDYDLGSFSFSETDSAVVLTHSEMDAPTLEVLSKHRLRYVGLLGSPSAGGDHPQAPCEGRAGVVPRPPARARGRRHRGPDPGGNLPVHHGRGSRDQAREAAPPQASCGGRLRAPHAPCDLEARLTARWVPKLIDSSLLAVGQSSPVSGVGQDQLAIIESLGDGLALGADETSLRVGIEPWRGDRPSEPSLRLQRESKTGLPATSQVQACRSP